jgi:hypothetical protein
MKTITNVTHMAIALVAFAWLTLVPTIRAVDPPPDGGYPVRNTAEGDDALFSLTTGTDNTAIGFNALDSDTTGCCNTATGVWALLSNTGGVWNTAYGANAMISNDNGGFNVANGSQALFSNTSGNSNTAVGANALFSNQVDNSTAVGAYALTSNTTGDDNTAVGFSALASNQTGFGNTAVGVVAVAQTTAPNNTGIGAFALTNDTTGFTNTAVGQAALINNTTGFENIALGAGAGFNLTTGHSNIALGTRAGINLSTGNNNIDVGNQGVAAESNTIRIGMEGTQKKTFVAGISTTGVMGSAVKISSNGQLGVAPSSARFKQQIQSMNKTSEVLLALRPVTFRYKQEVDPECVQQFGLVAEEVEKVHPDLVARDTDGKVFTVRYEAVNAMLLNEFLKEHKTVQQQQKEIDALKGEVKEQREFIQKVNDKVELNRSAPKMVATHPR